jgi:hypothetical protein
MITRDQDAASTGYRELAHREANGISVRLWWHPREDQVYVHVINEPDGDEFVLNPAKSEALSVFNHPYAHTLAGR